MEGRVAQPRTPHRGQWRPLVDVPRRVPLFSEFYKQHD